MTSSLRPRRSVESPVPPPSATTLKLRERLFGLEMVFFTDEMCHITTDKRLSCTAKS